MLGLRNSRIARMHFLLPLGRMFFLLNFVLRIPSKNGGRAAAAAAGRAGRGARARGARRGAARARAGCVEPLRLVVTRRCPNLSVVRAVSPMRNLEFTHKESTRRNIYA